MTGFGKTYHRPDLVWQRQREHEFYEKLDGVPHFPDVIGVDDGVLIITHCGTTIPVDVDLASLESQLGEILDLLEEHGIRHRDITIANLCWDEGFLSLVDFGWARWETEEDSPEPVPQVMREWMVDKSDREQADETLKKLKLRQVRVFDYILDKP